jgi:hypothetical protein
MRYDNAWRTSMAWRGVVGDPPRAVCWELCSCEAGIGGRTCCLYVYVAGCDGDGWIEGDGDGGGG